MNKSRKLALKSILASPYRSLGLMTIMLLLSFVIVFGNILVLGMRNGSKNIVEKMGADIVVVPKDCEEDFEGILLTTDKNFFYMNSSIVDEVGKIKGISKLSPQTFLMTLEASCCDQSAQIVGIDIDSDFTITPWANERKLSALEQGEIIVGSNVGIREDNTFHMYDKTYKVAAVLDKSGTSMDQTVYVSQSEIEVLKQRAREKGQGFIKEVTENDISAVMIQGESGAGKSTLINIISGLCKANSGKIYYDDKEITELSDTERAVVRNRYTGIVTQNCDLIPYLSVIENMKLAYEIGKKENDKREEEKDIYSDLLERLGLLSLKNEFPENLSGGEIKRAAIVRALITEPPIIIMDEPTSNLDSKNRTKVLQLLREKAEAGHTVIISSHEKEATEYADILFEVNRL